MSFVDSGCQKRDGFLRKAHQTTQENDSSSFKRQRSRISSFVKKNVKADIIEIFLKIVLPLQIYFGQPPRNSILLYWVDWVVSIPFSMPSFSSNSCNCRDNHIIPFSINRIFIVYDQIISLPFEKVNSVAFLTLVNTVFLLYILCYSFVYRSFLHQDLFITTFKRVIQSEITLAPLMSSYLTALMNLFNPGDSTEVNYNVGNRQNRSVFSEECYWDSIMIFFFSKFHFVHGF